MPAFRHASQANALLTNTGHLHECAHMCSKTVLDLDTQIFVCLRVLASVSDALPLSHACAEAKSHAVLMCVQG